MSQPQILVIEDDPDIQELLRFTLEKEGFGVMQALSAEEGLSKLHRAKADLVVLDIMLPGMSGMDVLRRLKGDVNFSSVRIIMASARSEDPDVVLGLEMGADDYVVKPYSPRVLVARIRRLLRQDTGPSPQSTTGNNIGSDSTGEASFGPFRLIPERHAAWADERRLDLSATEYALLELFVRNPGIVFSRTRLITAVRGQDHAVTDRAVDVQILGLRKKLGPADDWIETVRGVGYRLKDES